MLKQADADTFKPVGSSYAVDKNSAWFLDHLLKKADPETLNGLKAGYATDKNTVFFAGEVLKKADAKTFHITEKYQGVGKLSYQVYGKDKNHLYQNGQIIK